MKRAASSFLITLAALSLAAAASAQTTTHPATTPPSKIQTPQASSTPTFQSTKTATIFVMPSMGESCPIGLRAQPGVGPGMVIIVEGNTTASQKLTLQLTNPNSSRHVTHAQITVHGLTAHGRVNPAVSDNLDAHTIAKQVDLALTVDPGASASTDMLFEGFTSVRWIDLDSVSYADGSTWHSSPQHNCQIVPDRFMLVASH